MTTPTEQDFLQPGSRQVAAGYAVYGPQTVLVLTTGNGVNCFTLDREMGSWVLTQQNIQIPADTKEYAINASNARHWYAPVQRYIGELLEGKTGPRGVDFNTRWIASMVADVHRILNRGGIFMYPADAREPGQARQAAPDVRSQPDGIHRRAGRWRRHRWQAAHHGYPADSPAPAGGGIPGFEE